MSDLMENAKTIRGELTKVRCWMTGFQAGRNRPGQLGEAIPGQDGVRQAIMLLDEIIHPRTPDLEDEEESARALAQGEERG